MISVGSRDGRKRIGLGLDMEETELEEGEALGYHEEGEESTIDPDIALSYIEEKVHRFLGHLQKDFEGGVSAENLGAKFGGYGSFLPTYQRSPSWSHTKSPAEAHNYESPRKPHTEDQRQNSLVSSSASPSIRPHAVSGKSLAVGSSLKGNGYLKSKHADESSLKSGIHKKSMNDQRTLKVRIKVGSENLSAQKNAELYCGLGLEVSPSSSMDDSPTTSEGQCGKLLGVPEASPTSILQIMTSYSGELLLSPLSEDLIHLTEKRKIRGKCETKSVDKTSKKSGLLGNGSISSRSNHKVTEQKKVMSSEKDDDFFTELSHQKNNASVDNNVSPLKKEKENDSDVFGYEELVSNALKLPLLSSSQHSVAGPSKDMSPETIATKDGMKRETFSPFIEKEHLESVPAQDATRAEKLVGRSGSSGKASESKEGNLVGTVAACPQEDICKAEKPHALDQSESNASKGIKALTAAEPTDPLKQLITQKGGSVNEEGLESSLEKSSIGGKRKRKEAQNKGSEGAYVAKDELMVESSPDLKSGKSSHTNSLISKNDTPEKPGDRYKDFFGDVEFEDDDNESVSGEMTSLGRLKDPKLFEKRNLSKDHNMSREKHISRNSEKPLEKYAKPVSRPAPPPLENGPSSEAPIGTVPLVQEDWVLCDKCKTWRLLPLGTNPKSLPDKWLCRMLTWLPGMNRCSIPEEETTNALRALYHPVASVAIPPPEAQDVRPNNSVMATVGTTPADFRPLAQEHQDVAIPTAPISGKKKHGSAVAANSADIDGPTNSSNSRKKNLGMLGKMTKMNNANNSPSVDASGQHMRQASMSLEKYNDVKAEKISQVGSSDKGTSVKIKSQRESDMEGSRASKRMKSEELHCDDENWTSDNGGASTKAGRRSSSLSNNDRDKYNNHRDFSGDAMKSVVSNMHVEMQVPSPAADGLLGSGKYDEEDSRKRRAKENHGSRTHNEPVSNSGQHYLHFGDFVEELNESEHRKEKKARLSKSGGKAMSGSKAGVGADRKSKSMKDQHDRQLVNGTQAVDYLKSDMASAHPSVAANSSSSKVSGSHRTKTNGQEVKGSPVESVSSSPLKSLNADKVTSARKSLDGRTDFHDSAAAANPGRFSGSDDGGNDRAGLDKMDAGGNDRAGLDKMDAVLTVNDRVDDVDQLCHSNQYVSTKHYSEQSKAEMKTNNDQSQSGVHSKKSGKGSSSHSKDKSRASVSDLEKIKLKASDSRNNALDHVHLHEEKSKSRRIKSDEKSGTPKKGEKFISKKDMAGGTSSESSKAPSHKKFGHDGQDAIRSQGKKHDLPQEHENEKLPKKSNQTEVRGNGKSHSLPPLARIQTDTAPVSGSQKENSLKGLAVDASDNGDALKASNQRKKPENSNGQPMRHPTPNSHRVRDVDAPSPVRRDSSSHAANTILKEATDLKHMADRLKNSGTSIGLYFEAALKFLHGASLLESGSSEATKHNELMRSMYIYSSTAKLCEFCAHDYEKSKDMGAAALAYKCMEVAYMRVVYSSHSNSSRDRAELQSALQIAAPGESPSSSASDVDNLNHQVTADKAASAKVVGSPQISGSHIITSRNRAGLLRVLNFAQDVTFAMEASRKSRIAFTAATSRLGETHKEGICTLKNALDYNFQDVEGLLQLVRVAMDAISL